MTPEYLEKRAVQIFLVSIFCVVAFIISGDIINKDYTIQDVYNWCCNKAECNTTLSPTGENCHQVIHNVYNGCYDPEINCNWKLKRD